MMPWEHAIVGYIAFSLFLHAFYRSSPTGGETIVVGLGSLGPDLIDKPLAWEFGVFPSGYALGHSIFFASTVAIIALSTAYLRGRPRWGWALGIGYLFHLPGDLVNIYIRDGHLPFDRVLWPVRVVEGPTDHGLIDGFIESTIEYLSNIMQLSGSPHMQFILGIMAFGALLWIVDGMPVVREAYLGARKFSKQLAH